jgi:arachidonate 15-lipoxygenase
LLEYALSRISLPQHDTPEGLGSRGRLLGVQRAAYGWVHIDGLPPFCDGVPAGEEFSESKSARFDWDLRGSVINGVVSIVRAFGREPKKVEDYNRYYVLRQRPSSAARWREDREFARQRLDGVNPFLIERVKQIPANFALTEEVAAPVLAPLGLTVAQLLGEGRLYLVDFESLSDVPIVVGRFLEPAIAAFFVDEAGVLAPLAIQLGQDPKAAGGVLFTPADDPWLWLLAKTFVQCADASYHEIVSHLVRTHLVPETCWVAANRTLAPTHPIHVLLRPHFTDTIAINTAARGKLIAPGGPIDKAIAVGSEGGLWLVDKAWKRWTFGETEPLADFARRDVNDLPGYHYRDDARRLYATISMYADELLRVFYHSEEDVRGDTELQAWAAELVSPTGGQIRGLPGGGKVERFKDLHAIVLGILWTVSAEHSAVNNGQFDQFGYVPNSPGALYLPAPKRKIPMNNEAFTYALPPELAVDNQIALVHLLSMPTHHPLGQYPSQFFQDVKPAQLVVDRFRARLDQDTLAIRARNETLDVPYRYLDPTIIGRSVAI